jgi:hypothetical protein
VHPVISSYGQDVIPPRVLAASVLLAVAPLLASCGGDEETSSPSTTEGAAGETTTTGSVGGDGSTTTTSAAAGGGGATSEFCEVSERLDAVFADEPQAGTKFTEEQIAVFEEAKAAAPDEISEAVTTVLDAYAERGYDESLFTDPEFTGAAQEVAVYVGANCDAPTDGPDAGDTPDSDSPG